MRTVFMGTPEFSATVLKKLCENGYQPDAVVTRADKPAGRGKALKKSAVKEYAESRNLEILQPEKLSEPMFLEKLNALAPELIIVVAYGRILPESVLNLPKYGCINAHASLLPKYRGAAPMQRAIMDGEKETGVTVMQMEKGLDTGDMLYVLKTPISETDNLESIHDRLAELSGSALLETIRLIETDALMPQKQDHSSATYAEKILRSDEILDFSEDAYSLSCKIRALSPFPNAVCSFNGKLLKITSAYSLSENPGESAFGEVISVKGGEIRVACGKGILAITGVFPESKRRMSASDFINGSKIKSGDMLEKYLC